MRRRPWRAIAAVLLITSALVALAYANLDRVIAILAFAVETI